MTRKLTAAAAVRMTSAELVAHLLDSGLSQREIARRIESNSPTLSRISTGQRAAGEDIYRRLIGLATGAKVFPENSPKEAESMLPNGSR